MDYNSTYIYGSIRLTPNDDYSNNTQSPPSYGYLNHTTPIIGLSSENVMTGEVNRDPSYVVIPMTIIYVIIFITGTIGNISTCIVISRNKSMHTATNYYLFSLAVSDFILLISGVPMELYYIWCKHEFIFGEAFCILRNAINEMSANATVLTITAFTIERYVAICHPFLSHTMSKLSRAIKFIFLIWILSIAFATPQAMQTGIVVNEANETWCTILDDRVIIEHSFLYATLLFFFAPMMLISVLYLLIGMKLRSSTLIKRENGNVVRNNNLHSSTQSNTSQSTKRVIKMLVAVVICFILCWLPFHFQRLVYVYATYYKRDDLIIVSFFTYTTYISGVLYYVSTCINPILYNLMSNKFRNAFKETLQKRCCQYSSTQTNYQKRQYRILSRGKRWNVQSEPSEYSGSGKDDYYSSSTQKQSIETITASRNTSCKQLSKYYMENFGKPLSIIETGASATSRFQQNINENETKNRKCNDECLSTKITGSEINLYPDCYISEIQLNIFPPAALYTPKAAITPTTAYLQGNKYRSSSSNILNNENESPMRSVNCLNIDVHENILHTLLTDICNENKQQQQTKSTSANFSHISFKKRDSILHIAIGNSSKIIKKSKHKRRWLFAKFYKISRRSNSKKDKNLKYLNSKFGSRDCDVDENNSIYHVNDMDSLNIVNDNLVITINKKSYDVNHEMNSSNDNNENSHLKKINNDNNIRVLEGDYGANELDFYMNEIKKRENRSGYEV